jgi:hypothetical protein
MSASAHTGGFDMKNVPEVRIMLSANKINPQTVFILSLVNGLSDVCIIKKVRTTRAEM